MEKNRRTDQGDKETPRLKLLLIMKLTFFFLLIGLLEVHASLHAQVKTVDLDVKNMALKEVFGELKKQTDLDFFFSNRELDANSKVTIQVKNAALTDVLTRLLGENCHFEITNGMVIIKPAEVKDSTRVESFTVCGWVVDLKKQAISGVTVKLEGVALGTSTDVKGWFSLNLPLSKGVLEFSFVGYESKKVSFTEKSDTLRVTLEEDVLGLEEVIVTGYQTLKQKATAGAYSRVTAKDLVMTGSETVEQMLQGRLPGMMVINTSGLTGTRQKVRVRGTSTLVGNAEPVWVVDGIIQEDPLPFQSSELTNISDDNLDMMKDFIGGAVAWLNPNDIEDITVLKDASATAIYGVKAANGVIVITTKKGERGRLSLKYSGDFSVGDRLNYNKMEIMNSKQRVALSREAYERGARVQDEKIGYTALALAYQRREISFEEFDAGAKRLETINTDWFDILYRTPFSHNHSISFSGGNENSTYRASFGYKDNQNTAKGNEQKTYTGSLNVTSIFWEQLTLSASLSGSQLETKAFANGVDPYSYAINTSRVIPCREDGELFYYHKGGYNYNILHELEHSGNRNTQKSLSFNLSARWMMLEGITLSTTIGGTTNSSFAETWFTERSHKITTIRGYEFGTQVPTDPKFQQSRLPYGGMLSVAENRNFNYTWRGQLEYVKNIGVHSLNLMAGVEARGNEYDGYSQTDYGYQPDRGKSFVDVPVQTPSGMLNGTYARSKPTVVDRVSNYFSYYMTGSYMYDSRYALNFSVRGDASNRFGQSTKHRFQPVWSIGVRWNVTDESWMEHQNIANNLALTATFGYQGNVAENVSPDLVAKLLPVDEVTGEYRMTVERSPSPDLKWEVTKSVDLGIDFSLFNSKINGSFNYYYKKTTDLITRRVVPYENGVTSMAVNGGDMKNTGWDLSFSVVPVRTKDFMWSIGTTFSGNDNNVKSNLQPTGNWKEATDGTLNKKGYPVSSFWAFRFTGLNPKNGGPEIDLSKANTEAASMDVTEFMTYAGKLEPDFNTGLNMTFRYKHLTLYTTFYLSLGNQLFLSSPFTSPVTMLSEYDNASKQLLDRWQKPGDEKYTNIPSIPVAENCLELHPFFDETKGLYPYEAWANSDARVVDAWYLRCQNIRLAYTFPEKLISGFAKDVSVAFTVSNPFQIVSSDYKGRDPEVAQGKQPLSRNFSLSVNLSF